MLVVVRIVAMGAREALVEYKGEQYWVWLTWIQLSPSQRIGTIDSSYLNDENKAKR